MKSTLSSGEKDAMANTRTLTVLSVGLVAAGLGLYWWLGQYNAQAVSPTDAPSGREGAAVDSSTESSLVNPLAGAANDGVFPEAAKAALSGQGGIVPSLARAGKASTGVEVKVNGFRVDSLGRLKFADGEPFEADYLSIAPIHPYFLNPGDNRLHIGAGDGGAIAVVSWDYVEGDQHQELLRVSLPAEGEHIFSWASKVPKRPWATGVQIQVNEGTKQGLYSEVAGLHSKLQALSAAAAKEEPTADAAAALEKEWIDSTRDFVEASKLRGKPYRLIDQILEAATARALPGKPAGSLELQPFAAAERLELEVFAGGTLARLKPASGAPLFAFVSNLPDGPRGQTGTTRLAFDPWYRQNDRGAWQLDALFPRLAPGTWTHFEQGPYELEDLFRLSNF
jgi:hypothetical protein